MIWTILTQSKPSPIPNGFESVPESCCSPLARCPSDFSRSSLLLKLQTIVLSLRWIGDGMYIDLFSLLKLKYHLVAVLGFQGAKIVPARDGKTFSVEIGGLHQLSPVALACASGLKRVLDSPKTLEFPPSAMYLSDSEPSNQLVGSAFADVVIKIFTSKIALEKMSYLEQRSWLECLMILSYKVGQAICDLQRRGEVLT